MLSYMYVKVLNCKIYFFNIKSVYLNFKTIKNFVLTFGLATWWGDFTSTKSSFPARMTISIGTTFPTSTLTSDHSRSPWFGWSSVFSGMRDITKSRIGRIWSTVGWKNNKQLKKSVWMTVNSVICCVQLPMYYQVFRKCYKLW